MRTSSINEEMYILYMYNLYIYVHMFTRSKVEDSAMNMHVFLGYLEVPFQGMCLDKVLANKSFDWLIVQNYFAAGSTNLI